MRKDGRYVPRTELYHIISPLKPTPDASLPIHPIVPLAHIRIAPPGRLPTLIRRVFVVRFKLTLVVVFLLLVLFLLLLTC